MKIQAGSAIMSANRSFNSTAVVMVRYLLIAISLCVVVQAAAYPPGFNTNICTPPTDNGGKNFPILPSEMVTEFEWKDLSEGTSLFVKEYKSPALNVGVTYMTGLLGSGITSKFISDGNSGQQLVISDVSKMSKDDCRVHDLDDIQPFSFPSAKPDKKQEKHKINSPAEGFLKGGIPVGVMAYGGREVVDGVSCGVWHGCLYVPTGELTISVRYHFSEESWRTASGDKSVPVRIQALGGSALSPDIFNQVFRYAYFSSKLPTDKAQLQEIFGTPENMYCEGRVSTRPLPAVPKYFSYKIEVYDLNKKTVKYIKEFYDFEAKYTRLDHDIGKNFTSKIISEISDFKTGLTYHIDRDTNQCQVRPVQLGPFAVLESGAIRMRTPEESFDFDQLETYPYQYTGVRDARGVACDTWISRRPYPTRDSDVMSTFHWHFSRVSNESGSRSIPILLRIYVLQLEIETDFHIFNFDEGKPDISTFDTSLCFGKDNKRTFTLQLSAIPSDAGAGNHETTWNSKNFTLSLRQTVNRLSTVSPIRVQGVQCRFNEDHVDVTFTILGVPKSRGVENVTPLHDAVEKITKAVNNGHFSVGYSVHGKTPVVFVPVEGTLTVQ